MDTVGGEFGVNARRSISATAAMMDVADAGLEDSIVLLARRQLTVSPGLVDPPDISVPRRQARQSKRATLAMGKRA